MTNVSRIKRKGILSIITHMVAVCKIKVCGVESQRTVDLSTKGPDNDYLWVEPIEFRDSRIRKKY